jgi:hypothetical protein
MKEDYVLRSAEKNVLCLPIFEVKVLTKICLTVNVTAEAITIS